MFILFHHPEISYTLAIIYPPTQELYMNQLEVQYTSSPKYKTIIVALTPPRLQNNL